MPTQQKNVSKPTTDQRFLTGLGIGFLTGGDSTGLKNKFSIAGAEQAPNTNFPDFGNLVDRSDDTFFGGFGQGEEGLFTHENPFHQTAANNLFSSQFELPEFTGGLGGNFAGGGFSGSNPLGAATDAFDSLGNLIPEEAVASAVDFLTNTPSVFDETSGGPIVSLIEANNAEFEGALTEKAMADLDDATEIALSNDMAGGLLSGSTILLNRERLARGVLLDLNTLVTQGKLQNTQFLFDMAIQDLTLQSNNMQSIIESALTEKNINANFAAAMAKIASDEAIAQAGFALEAQIANANIGAQVYNTQVNALLQQDLQRQENALAALNLGSSDFGASQDRFLNTSLFPLEFLASLNGGQASRGSSFSL